MSEKNMLGMDMSHWKHLSGLADPYSLTEGDAVLHLKQDTATKVFGGGSDDDDDAPSDKFVDPRVAKIQALMAKKRAGGEPAKKPGKSKGNTPENQAARGAKAAEVAKGARKTRMDAAKFTPAQQDRAERKRGEAQQRIVNVALAKKKKFARPLNLGKDEDIELTMDDLWEAFLEDRGTSIEEFEFLSGLALESNDHEIAQGMLALEDEFHEVFGAIGAGIGAAARGVAGAGKLAAKGIGAAAKAGVGAAKAVGGAVADNFKAGYANARTPVAAAPAPGFAPTAPPPAGPAPAMPVGATPPAQAAAPAQAAQAAGAVPPQSGMNPQAAAANQQKPSLLGRIGKGIGQLSKGVKGIATAPLRAAGNLVGGAVKGYRGEDVEAWEAYLSESYGLSVDEYLEACEQAYEYGDMEMIEQLHVMDEGILDFLRGGAAKKKEQQDAHAATLDKWKEARAVTAKHGVAKTKAASVRGQQVGVKPKLVVGTSTRVPRAIGDAMESVMRRQLQFSGYTSEYLEERTKGTSK